MNNITEKIDHLFMKEFKTITLVLFTILLTISCSGIPDRSWSDAIPEKSPFVIIPEDGATLTSVLQSSYTPFLDDITASAAQLLSRVDSTAHTPINLNAIMLYPGVNNQLETVWMAQAPEHFIDQIKSWFYMDFTQNQYQFNEVDIHILHLGERQLFAAQLNDELFISESSLSLEEAIRAYIGNEPRADLSGISLKPGHIVMNTPSLDQWIIQLARVIYRPIIKNALKGTKPTLLSIARKDAENEKQEFELSGDIPLNQEEVATDLVAAFSSHNSPITLDRYIPSNAAATAFLRLPPRKVPPSSLPDTTQLDSVMMTDNVLYSDLAGSLDAQFSLVMFAQSGFLSTGEHLFLRKISNAGTIKRALNRMVREGKIEYNGGVYIIRSNAIAKLIGSSLCTFQNFYLDIIGDVVAISKRKGLVETISSDRNRRRTIYYEETFRDVKNELPESISGFFIANSEFYSFINPFLSPNNNLSAFTSKFDLLTISASANNDESIALSLKTYQTRDRSAPYEEKWLFPTGSELSGKPILADIGGSERKEVIFATESGNVFALAADGTVVMQAETSDETPIGSPAVYDWYATNQDVILLAAGNKIYGWNDNGQLLPRFPFELNEQITSPIIVGDIDRNGLPNVMVATADRKLHLLNGRGENISGWPVTTNAEITSKPTIENYRGALTVFAFTENALHGWRTNGSERENFPKFINASFNGSPVLYKENILGNAADGYLYSIGPKALFADSLNVFETSTETSDIEAIYASNSPLTGSPSILNMTVDDEGKTYREPMILTMSANGSAFLININGQLRFTQNMGQPAAPGFSPFVSDIDMDGNNDIIALANFGRLYVWKIINGERLYTVPTSGMQYPIIADIDEDGYNELIAQTSEGLRTWTIFGGDAE